MQPSIVQGVMAFLTPSKAVRCTQNTWIGHVQLSSGLLRSVNVELVQQFR